MFTGSDATFTFTYNPASQIKSRIVSNDAYAFIAGPASHSYAVNGQNQLTTATGATYGYDANGNLTSDGSTTFAYDAENRLLSASGAKAGTLSYDSTGRLEKLVTGGVTGFYGYDGPNRLIEAPAVGGTTARRYVFGAGADEALVWYEGAGTTDRRFLHPDHQGSIIAISDAAGNASTINRYDEHGVPASTNAGAFQYTGQLWVPQLALYHYKARAYAPQLGRFMQIDPVGYEDHVNLYVYARGDPVGRIDVNGEKSYLVVRPLSQMLVNKLAGHAFIVSNARFVGDPKATVHSFGPLANGNMGNLTTGTPADSARGTHGDDVASWESLRPSSKHAYGAINAPDQVVDAIANAVTPTTEYAYVPKFTPDSTNSNSAALAVARFASSTTSGDPVKVPKYVATPGSELSHRVPIDWKKVCSTNEITCSQ